MRNFWKFSPGEQAKFWNGMLKKGIASIGWCDFDYTNKSVEEIAQINPDLGRGSVRIIHLFNQFKVGDVILAFKGRQNIIGYGLVKSLPVYTVQELHPGSIHHNYVEVDWHPLNAPYKTSSSFAIDTVSNVTERYHEFSEILSDDLISAPDFSRPVSVSNNPNAALFAEIGKKIGSLQNNPYPQSVSIPVSPAASSGSSYKIFISYRRNDEAKYLVPTIAEKLNQRYGIGTAFYDVDNIPLGVDFRDYLKSAIEKSYIVLVVMGKDWVGQEADNSRRIDRPNDFVRIEVESALAMNKIVIPVLTGNAVMPQESDLPESIGSLAFRNAAKISSGTDYNSHFNALLSAIDPLINQ